MKCKLLFVWLTVLMMGQVGFSAEQPNITGHQTKTLEGWTVLVNENLLQKEETATQQALELLALQLKEIVEKVPKKTVEELQKVPLWFSPEYEGFSPRAEYHPGADWLKENQRDPAMVKAIEFTNIRIFERESKRMPNFALHELAHAYHDRVLLDGFDNQEIKDVFEKAKSKGLYEKVEQRFGDGRTKHSRSYALFNHKEYFAECSEAFFSTNDFFPFNCEQLAKYDPEMFALLTKLWSDPGATK